jgi:DNA-binding response OmpR family regulator
MTPQGRILCVQDDSDTRRLITFVLNQQGFEVIPTEDGAQALRLVKRIPFNLYIVDTWMPVMSGLELCDKLREIDTKTPILFFSAAAYDADKKRAFECGAAGYLVKPVDTDELVLEVFRLVSKARRQKKKVKPGYGDLGSAEKGKKR